MIPRAGEIDKALRERYGDGSLQKTGSVIEELAVHFGLTPQELAESDGSHPRFAHSVHSVLARHRNLGLLVRAGWGCFRYLPNKVADYRPRHHRPRTPEARPQSTSEADLLRRLKRRRRALTIAIRELERGG